MVCYMILKKIKITLVMKGKQIHDSSIICLWWWKVTVAFGFGSGVGKEWDGGGWFIS